MTERQVFIISPSIHDLTVKAILKDAGGEVATKRLAQRKLNNAGAITNHCRLQISPARIKKLLSALELTASLAEINALTTSNKESEKCKADTELMDISPATLVKFYSDKIKQDVSKLTKKEICALSLRFFGVLHKESNPKPWLISALQGLITSQPAVLTNAHAAAAGAPSTATATEPEPAPLTTPEAAAAVESNEDYDPDE